MWEKCGKWKLRGSDEKWKLRGKKCRKQKIGGGEILMECGNLYV
jgi:hypothetical protein